MLLQDDALWLVSLHLALAIWQGVVSDSPLHAHCKQELMFSTLAIAL